MCVVSNIMGQGISTLPWNPTNDFEMADLKKRIKQLEDAMQAAKKVDEYLKTPGCEDALKKKVLEEHAKRLGITISFP